MSCGRVRTKSQQSIGTKIRKNLQHTEFSTCITDRAWQYNWMNGLRVDVSKLLRLAPGDRVLDVGCGDGWFSLQNGLLYPKVRFIGVDLYETEDAQGISRLTGITNCSFYQRDALKMHISGKFDSVVLFMSLGNICETISDIRSLLMNCRRLMKDCAKLMIVEPFEEDFPKAVRNKVMSIYDLYKAMGKSRGEDQETILSRRSTLQILRNSNFDVIGVANRRFRWYMRKDAVVRYFGLETLPFNVPERFWVFDKPRQVTIILAQQAS